MKKEKIKENIIKMAQLQKSFRDMYRKTGLVGIGDDYVHIKRNIFLKWFNNYEIEDNTLSYHLNSEYDGVKFITVVDYEDEEYKQIKKEYILGNK